MYRRQKTQSEPNFWQTLVMAYSAMFVLWALMEIGEFVVATVNSFIAAIGL